jgi:hypothetical protein
MLIISYIIVVVKIFLLLLSNDLVFLLFKLCLGVSLISTYSIYRYKRDSSINLISLEDLYIKNYLYTISMLTLCTTSVITTMFIYKTLNIGKKIDLKVVYANIKEWFMITDISILTINCIVIVGFFLWMLTLITKIKYLIFYEFLKIHLYLIPFDYYYKFYSVILINSHYVTSTLLRLKIVNVKYKTLSIAKANKLLHYCHSIEEHLALIIIAISIIYDILVNGFVLTKIYYVFPVAYLYLIWRLLVRFITARARWIDSDLNIYLYKTPSSVSENSIIYEDGSELSMEDLADIREYILRGFTINFSNTKVIDQFIDKQKATPEKDKS